MHEDFKEFLHENRSFCIAFIITVFICIASIWLLYDSTRNEPIYTDTNQPMADIENRITNIEQRIDTMQERIANAEKTVSGTIITIRESRSIAETVTNGISRTEERLDGIIQRQGRIANIIADIETENRKRTENPKAPDLAK